MNEVVFNTLKEKDFIVKNFLVKVVKELNLTLNDLLLLIYFSNQEEPTLNIGNITSLLYLKEEEIMESFSKFIDLNLITIEYKKNKKGLREEIISLDNIIEYVTTDKIKKDKKQQEENLFEIFEKEFGRTLSPMEYEIINDWMEQGIEEDLIKEALREAIYNGAKSLRYISKILLAWKEKGYKSPNDVKKSIKEESNNNIIDIFDYNWIDED